MSSCNVNSSKPSAATFHFWTRQSTSAQMSVPRFVFAPRAIAAMFPPSACDVGEDQREGKKRERDTEDCMREKRRDVK